ncbi:protein RRP6-like 2 [Actinidia eriantha]|uniref:protein RRP6-like 2 n=1 Tax=Actinidia eriantha TaxID=165200 RepID=UPI0025831073|nr:protein RRP6-like 2 [Actinidia eriantha]
MSREAMEVDPSQKVEALQSFASGPLSSSIAKLSGSSRGLPSDKDFHFYYNFDEFKVPMKEIADSSQLILSSIGSSAHFWGKEMGFPEDLDDAYDWLVNVNDEVFERFDESVDEFQKVRKKEEESGVRVMNSGDLEDGFQLVCGKKKTRSSLVEKDLGKDMSSSSGVTVASRDKKTMGAKPKVPFHIPTIRRPQDEFKIVVNNSNQPFEHVWLQRSDDGSRFIHPLEKFSILDFVDKNVEHVELVKPPPIESTPFKLVEEVKDLKELAAKLRGLNEFAVDLEHNQYRSFQGLTCLMQISTRTEDFVIDTLKLRIHIGPHLREVFKDPMKKKVMHGADRDIMWLQRDFGIYVCNMFDTGQASRVLKLERNSLEYLLYHFCGVTANKEYQNADWRLRPLPDVMLRYAREDTHYLLHIYDLLRIRLLSESTESEKSDDLLVEVYKRSYDICMQLYEKELFTDSSYLFIYGLQGADLNAVQLAIVAGLCEWRDVVARAEDESTGYVLPNKTLLEIAKQIPSSTGKLRRLVNSKHPYVECNIGSVVSIIRHSILNAAAFEAAVELLKEARMQTASEEHVVSADGNEALPTEAPATLETVIAAQGSGGGISLNDSTSEHPPASVLLKESLEFGDDTAEIGRNKQESASEHAAQNGHGLRQVDNKITELPTGSPIISGKAAGASVQVLKKPSRAFGAILGNSSAKRKFGPDKKEKEEIKLEQIKSSVNLPFHSFVPRAEQLQPPVKEPPKMLESTPCVEPSPIQAASVEDVILLSSDEETEDSSNNEKAESSAKRDETGESVSNEAIKEPVEHREDKTLASAQEMDEDGTMSLGDLSSSFQDCFKSINETRKPKRAEKSIESGGFLQLKPFDYESARKEVRFGEHREAGLGEEGDDGHRTRRGKVDRKKSSGVGQSHKDDEMGDFQQGRRRQAFPASGNRSATFR